MSVDQVRETVIEALPLGRLRAALADSGAYLVGGVTRTMFGAEPLAGDDIDIAIEGDVEQIASRLAGQGFDVRTHERFGTATITAADGTTVDLARTRSERYELPGSLPIVEPASIAEDLARRDFTINAIAVALDPPHLVVDPHGGRADLERGELRVLHDRSFIDDPTRAIRAARYAARLDMRLADGTAELIEQTDLSTVSADRLNSELRRLAREPSPQAAFRLLAEWELIELPPDALELIGAVEREAALPTWSQLDPEERLDALMLAAGYGDEESRERALSLGAREPASPSEGESRAARLSEEELLLAAAAGAAWVRSYVTEWRNVALAIDGRDLIDAGVEPGPAIGRGLSEARKLLLDGGIGMGREEQLAVALQAAGSVE